MGPMIGQTFSHFKILKELGRGGFGVVWLAEDLNLPRKVALKVLNSEYSSDEEAKSRFRREAVSIAAVDHQNIITVYDVGEFDGRYYISMQYIDGKSLKESIGHSGVPIGRAVDIGIKICEGLNAAHRVGVTHRDITPKNILLYRDDQVKLIDFGLARLKDASRLTQSGVTMGTEGYTSPEQARGDKEIDARTDIFSFGVVLYEMITGRLPFDGEHKAAIYYAIQFDDPLPLSRYNQQASVELQKIVDRALAKKKEDRFKDTEDLLAELKGFKDKTKGRTTEQRELEPPAQKSIAVLFFENKSEDRETEYFSDGITEEIINDLTKIEGVQVRARDVVRPFKDKPVDIPFLAERLKVDHILRGSVWKQGERIRITAQLVDPKTLANLWGDTYIREFKQVFELQEELAKDIARAIKGKVSKKEEEDIGQRYRGSLEAYELYLKGRSLYHKYDKEDLWRAVQFFRQALTIDPDYVLAYAGLADSYIQLIDRGFESDKQILKDAEIAALQAVDKDPYSAEAHKALGTYYYKVWQFKKAKEHLRRALQLNTTLAVARANLGTTYLYLGEFEKAEQEYRLAYENDPTLYLALWLLARFYLGLNNFLQAEASIQRVLQSKEPAHQEIGNFILSRIYFFQGNYAAALECMHKYVSVHGGDPAGVSGLAAIHAGLGKVSEAKAELKKALKEMSLDEDVVENLILTYVLLQDQAKAFEWIKRGIKENKILWVFLEYNPFLDEIRKETEFQKWLLEVKSKTLSG